MKNQNYLLILISVLIFTFNGCKQNSDPAPIPAEIQNDLKVYVDRFISEGALRDKKVDLSGYKISYNDTLKYYCGYGFYDKKQVIINYDCWKSLTDLGKEKLMFHELGHAYLGRVHNNTQLDNGDYKTIMTESDIYYDWVLYSEYTPEKRKYYLDELFNSSIISPTWASQKTKKTIIFQDSISTKSNNWQYINTPNSTQIGELNSLIYSSAGNSLSIRSTTSSLSTFSYWSRSFVPQGIKQSSRLTLTVTIKLDKVTEGGVGIALRGDDDNTKTLFFNSTEGSRKIIGSTGFVEYRVDVPYYLDAAKKVYVFLIMDGRATGTVYFDDITLTNYE
jgi:hypothetical protein